MSKLWSVALSNVTVGWSAHCKIVVFPDHTACTDPGNIIGERGGGGGGGVVQAHPPQVFQSTT